MSILALAEASVGLREAQEVPQNGREKPDAPRDSEGFEGVGAASSLINEVLRTRTLSGLFSPTGADGGARLYDRTGSDALLL